MLMQCYCCGQEMASARKVKLRPVRAFNPDHGPESMAYQSYREETTFRWAFICNPCYRNLDNEIGVAAIPGHGQFCLAGSSRGDKASTVNERKYQQFRRREAERLGLD
jgi:hypothetical protein